MSPRKNRISEKESKKLISFIKEISNCEKSICTECKELIEEYLEIDPGKANFRLDGVEGAPLLAFALAKSTVGCRILFEKCASYLDADTLNFFTNGRSLLSFLSCNKKWCEVLYTEKNFGLITTDAFNFGGNTVPASIVLLSRHPEKFLDDFIAAKFQPLICKKYMSHRLFDNLLNTSIGIMVLLKYRDIRDVLNRYIASKGQGATLLCERLNAKSCEPLKNLLAKEAKTTGYDDTSNLFQSYQSNAGYCGYQNNNGLK